MTLPWTHVVKHLSKVARSTQPPDSHRTKRSLHKIPNEPSVGGGAAALHFGAARVERNALARALALCRGTVGLVADKCPMSSEIKNGWGLGPKLIGGIGERHSAEHWRTPLRTLPSRAQVDLVHSVSATHTLDEGRPVDQSKKE